jgi:hypothetical protein
VSFLLQGLQFEMQIEKGQAKVLNTAANLREVSVVEEADDGHSEQTIQKTRTSVR